MIADSHTDAIAVHGDLGLSIDAWTQRISNILRRCDKDPEEPGAAAFAARLHNRDLYLTTCCAERRDNAWRRFESLYQKYIDEIARSLARSAPQAFDVGEGLLVDLFLPDRSGQSRIASYDGRSSLPTWLHVIVTHRVANERVRKWNKVERLGDVSDMAGRSAVVEVEAHMRAKRYGRAIDESLRKACEKLSPAERKMLIWRYQRGLMLEEIARMLSIHPSTVCRRLDRVQDRLRKDVIAILAGTYGVPMAAIGECVNDVRENRTGSVSLLRLIAGALRRDGDDVDAPPRQLHIA